MSTEGQIWPGNYRRGVGKTLPLVQGTSVNDVAAQITL